MPSRVNNIGTYLRNVTALLSIALLCACGTSTHKPPYGGIKIGKPYEVNGHIYVPRYVPDYDETGIASWYGPGFHGGQTANGERYNQNDLTAAHKTLPLPSVVRVTNLDNGESAIVRINDRGPFVAGRIIDLSKGSAVALGVYRNGTAKVRVQYLDKETRDYVSALPGGIKALAALDSAQSDHTTFASIPATDAFSRTAPAVPEPVVPDLPFTSTVPATTAAPVPTGQIHNVRKQEIIEISDIASDGTQESPANTRHDTNDALPFVAPVTHGQAATPHDWQALPAPQPATMPSVASTVPTTPIHTVPSAHGLFIQVATFGVRDNAQRMQTRLQNLAPARITEIHAGSHVFYRVLVGAFKSQQDTKNMLSKLESLGISGARVIHN